MGYITLFTLPYDLETLAYTTPKGSVVGPFSHPNRLTSFFKVTDERAGRGENEGQTNIAGV